MADQIVRPEVLAQLRDKLRSIAVADEDATPIEEEQLMTEAMRKCVVLAITACCLGRWPS